ncbi:photosystem II protein Psb27 [Phormidium tenue FACHB-886]|nr:photosystem II protein Psb27 [Phormidium tenue FACHB-886]
MKTFLSRFIALALVLVIGLMGCSAAPAGLSGNYRQDTLALISTLRTALDAPTDSPTSPALQSEARTMLNNFFSRYRRDGSLAKLNSFTTMRTALNSLAGHYSSYPNRPVPAKLKKRLTQEFNQVEMALKREP